MEIKNYKNLNNKLQLYSSMQFPPLARESSLPMYLQIKSQIKQMITDKYFQKDKPLPTEQKLCDIFDVSRITVRKAMLELVNENLLVRIPSKGTFVVDEKNIINNSILNSATKTQKPCFIGLFIPPEDSSINISDTFFTRLTKGIIDSLKSINYHLIISKTELKNNRHSFKEKFFGMKNISGIIFIDPKINDIYIKQAIQEKIPLVVMGKYIGDEQIPTIDINNIDAFDRAIRHLAKLGHKKIALINGPINMTVSLDHLQAYQKALKKYNLQYDYELVVNGNFDIPSGKDCMNKLLSLDTLPTAVITGDDLMAIGALQAIEEHKLKVPQDISIIAHNGTRLSEQTFPFLSSLQVPIYEQSKTATEMLLKIIKVEKLEKTRVLLPVKFNIRNSTGKCKK